MFILRPSRTLTPSENSLWQFREVLWRTKCCPYTWNMSGKWRRTGNLGCTFYTYIEYSSFCKCRLLLQNPYIKSINQIHRLSICWWYRSQPNPKEPQEDYKDIIQGIQSSLNTWEGGLQATVGAIVPGKSHCYVVNLKWSNGNWKYTLSQDNTASLSVKRCLRGNKSPQPHWTPPGKNNTRCGSGTRW
jgi:hypothetical protein